MPMRFGQLLLRVALVAAVVFCALGVLAPRKARAAEGMGLPKISIDLQETDQPTDMVPAIKIVALLTVLSVAPAILLMMTSFTRILVVLSFVRQALGTNNMPPNQVIVGLALFL